MRRFVRIFSNKKIATIEKQIADYAKKNKLTIICASSSVTDRDALCGKMFYTTVVFEETE